MSDAFVLSGRVKVDAAAAAKELARVTDELADQRIALKSAQDAVKQLAAEHRKLQASGEATGQELVELVGRLKAAEVAEISAANAVKQANAALNNQRQAMGQAAVSVGQMKASSANLGQQLGDVAQGLALGVSPATIFAQQAGQVAFALQGMGGAATGIAAFLSGPWGTALTLALVAFSPFIGKLFESGDASEQAEAAMQAQKSAAEELARATAHLDEVTGKTNRTVQQSTATVLARAQADVAAAQAARAVIATDLDKELIRQRALVSRSSGPGERGELAALGADAARGAIAGLEAQKRENEFAAAGARLTLERITRQTELAAAIEKVRLSTDAAAAAEARYKAEMKALNGLVLTRAELDKRVASITATRDAALRAVRTAEEAAAKATRDSAKATREVAAEEKRRLGFVRDITAAIGEYEDAQRAAARTLQDRFDPRAALTRRDAETGRQIDDALAAGAITPQQAEAYRQALGVETGKALVGILEDELPDVFGDAGRAAGGAFNDAVLTQAIAIGQSIGGVAGGLIRTAAGVAQGLGNGNFTGVGGPLGGLLTLVAGAVKGGEDKETRDKRTGDTFATAFRSEFKGAFTDMKNGFSQLFDGLGATLKRLFSADGEFGKMLGGVLGTAASGAAVGAGIADIGGLLGIKLNKGNAQIGGAVGGMLGSAIGGPLGKALGSVIGSIAGGLVKPKNPYADVALTSSADGVAGNVFASRKAGSSESGLTLAGGVNDALARAADTLGATIRPGVGLGSIGFSGEKFYFNPNGGDFKGAGAQIYASAEAAVSAAVAAAFQSNALEVSPRVQAALGRYSDNVDKALAEALKVKDLEDLLTDAGNPFARIIRDFERQAAQRLDVARRNGFDIAQIEKLNADERRKVVDQALQQSVGSAKALLDELRFGGRAEGSFGERRSALLTERDRLQALSAGGDVAAGEKLVTVLQQLLDVSSEGYGATGVFAADRVSTITQLDQLIAQREAQIEAAATAAKAPDPQLTEANASLDDLVKQTQQQTALLQQLVGLSVGVGGGTGNLGARFARFVQ